MCPELSCNIVEKLSELYIKVYGERIRDGKCVYCQEPVTEDGYCNCLKSDKVNKISRKLRKKVSEIANYKAVGKVIDFSERRNIPLKYASVSTDAYNARTDAEKFIKSVVKGYQCNLLENYITGENLLMLGNYGNGKTLLMSALCNHTTYAYKELSARYTRFFDIMAEIKTTFSDGSERTEQSVVNMYRGYDFLFIDELYKDEDGLPSDYDKKMFSKIADARYLEYKPTIISANVSLDRLIQVFGEASISRLMEKGQVIYFNAENERLKAA